MKWTGPATEGTVGWEDDAEGVEMSRCREMSMEEQQQGAIGRKWTPATEGEWLDGRRAKRGGIAGGVRDGERRMRERGRRQEDELGVADLVGGRGRDEGRRDWRLLGDGKMRWTGGGERGTVQ